MHILFENRMLKDNYKSTKSSYGLKCCVAVVEIDCLSSTVLELYWSKSAVSMQLKKLGKALKCHF